MASVGLLGLLGAACGGDDDAESASDSPTPGSQATTTLSTEAEVEAAYLAYWDMLDRLAQAPDPDDPEIPQRADGEALSEVVAGLTMLRERGQVAEIGDLYGHSVQSVEVTGDEAVVRDCAVDDSRVLDAATGEVIEPGDAATGLLEVRLILGDNYWQVDSVERLWTEPGAISCEDRGR